jgi:hypothetical protein
MRTSLKYLGLQCNPQRDNEQDAHRLCPQPHALFFPRLRVDKRFVRRSIIAVQVHVHLLDVVGCLECRKRSGSRIVYGHVVSHFFF